MSQSRTPIKPILITSIADAPLAPPTDSDAFEKGKAQGKLAPLAELCPARRYAVPEEIAAVALFLASDESSFVSSSTHLNLSPG